MKTEISTFSPASRKVDLEAKLNPAIPSKSGKIAVVGAGIFGVCAAYFLVKKGYNVSLFDKRGPGNSASSSGGESRLLRLIYGASNFYSDLTFKAIPFWMDLQRDSEPFFIPSPVLWISGEQNRKMIEDSLSYLDSLKVKYHVQDKASLQKKWPYMNIEDIEFAVVEELSGYLKARDACRSIASKFVKEGGRLQICEANPPTKEGDALSQLEIGGKKESFDYVIVAAGPWLNQWVNDPLIEVTRQDVLYFDLPNAARALGTTSWVDLAYEPYFYGIPGDLSRGFKLACDLRGATFDPDIGDRIPDKGALKEARKFLEHRFPSLADSALLEYRVCQYSNTIDRNLIMDIHPRFKNVLLMGGGSGHGFKYGPALGNIAAEFVAGKQPLPAEMRYF